MEGSGEKITGAGGRLAVQCLLWSLRQAMRPCNQRQRAPGLWHIVEIYRCLAPVHDVVKVSVVVKRICDIMTSEESARGLRGRRPTLSDRRFGNGQLSLLVPFEMSLCHAM